MNITELIQHPEQLDRDTLYELRQTLALYPYYQPARLLMLQNLYLLHDPDFNEELRRAAIYVTDRRVLFRMIEAAHFKIRPRQQAPGADAGAGAGAGSTPSSRTLSLIDSFLDSVLKESDEEEKDKKSKRKPTPADAAIDYVAYLLETEDTEGSEEPEVPEMRGQQLIDSFINNDKGRIVLPDAPDQQQPSADDEPEDVNDNGEGYFTETLARIYIKQGRYSKALEIIRHLSLVYPKKNAYFADQIRFLQKLIINNNNNK